MGALMSGKKESDKSVKKKKYWKLIIIFKSGGEISNLIKSDKKATNEF